MRDELQALREWTPGGNPDPDAAHRARLQLAAQIDAAREVRRPRRRLWFLVAPPAVAAAVAAVVLVVSVGSDVQDGHVRVASARASAALESAARAAERRPAASPFPRPDQFFYTRTDATYLDTSVLSRDVTLVTLDTQHREAWLSERRPGAERTVPGPTRFPSAYARSEWVRAGRPVLRGQPPPGGLGALGRTRYTLGNDSLTTAQMLAFDDTGEQLYRRLRHGVAPGQGPSVDGEVFVQIADALREQAAPPRLRAALYRALAYVPGIRLLGATHDRLGRAAVAVARTEHAHRVGHARVGGTRTELLFDPDSSELLAERQVMLSPPPAVARLVPPGTVIADAVYVRRGVVDHTGQRPK
jgi:hypothetical protein